MKYRWLLLLILPVCALGCDSANPVAPSGTVLSVTANPTLIARSNQASIITVTGFRPDGNPLNPGTQINIATSMGTLQPIDGELPGGLSVVQADNNGRAQARLFGDGRPGEATVTASLPTGGETSAMVVVQIGDGTLNVTADPPVIALTDEAALITVVGLRPDGNPLEAGVRISLSTSLGTLHPVDRQVPGGISVVETDANGQAQARLFGDGRPGDAMVTASFASDGGGGGGGEGGGGGGGGSAMVTVRIGEPDDGRPSVVISANPTILAVGASSRISLLGRAADGTALGAGHRFRLTANLGFLVEDGGTADDPRIDEAFTDSNGEAFVTFIAGDRGGTGSVSAILGTSEETTVMLTIRDALDSLSLLPSKTSIQRLDAGDTVVFTAVLTDNLGEPVSGVTVTFETERGGFADNTVPSNAQGEAMATLTVTAQDVENIPAGGTFDVTAEATSEGSRRQDTVSITVTGAP